jgi:hypothetical protein
MARNADGSITLTSRARDPDACFIVPIERKQDVFEKAEAFIHMGN